MTVYVTNLKKSVITEKSVFIEVYMMGSLCVQFINSYDTIYTDDYGYGHFP